MRAEFGLRKFNSAIIALGVTFIDAASGQCLTVSNCAACSQNSCEICSEGWMLYTQPGINGATINVCVWDYYSQIISLLPVLAVIMVIGLLSCALICWRIVQNRKKRFEKILQIKNHKKADCEDICTTNANVVTSDLEIQEENGLKLGINNDQINMVPLKSKYRHDEPPKINLESFKDPRQFYIYRSPQAPAVAQNLPPSISAESGTRNFGVPISPKSRLPRAECSPLGAISLLGRRHFVRSSPVMLSRGLSASYQLNFPYVHPEPASSEQLQPSPSSHVLSEEARVWVDRDSYVDNESQAK